MVEDIQKVLDLFNGEFAPEVIEDSQGIDFNAPINGKYRCRIVSLERKIGVGKESGKDYDFFALKLQAEEDVEGDKSGRRYLDKVYFNGTSEYSDDAEKGVKDLFNALFTADLLKDLTFESKDKYEAAMEIAPQLVDKMVNVSAYKGKTGKQVVRIVNEFKLKKSSHKEEVSEDW